MSFVHTSQSLLTRIRSLRIPPSALIGAALLGVACVGVLVLGPAFSNVPVFTAPTGDQQENASSSESSSAPATSSDESGGDTQAASQSDPASFVTVHVAGAVANPGLYSLPEGGRVQDAVNAAGGFLSDASPDAINLARVLQDGEQVVIPTLEQVESETAASASVTGSTAAAAGAQVVVNINTAGVEELDTLPGVGPATAQAIVDERESNGPFASIEDIQRVSGIGEKKFEKLRDSICV